MIIAYSKLLFRHSLGEVLKKGMTNLRTFGDVTQIWKGCVTKICLGRYSYLNMFGERTDYLQLKHFINNYTAV